MDPDRDPDHFALCKRGIRLSSLVVLAKNISTCAREQMIYSDKGKINITILSIFRCGNQYF